MPKYWHIPKELTIDGITYTSEHARSADSRTWYSDNPTGYNEHFTVAPTGSGQDEFEKFHMSIEFREGRNAGIYYVSGTYSHPPRLDNFTESERADWNAWYGDDETVNWIEELAQKFWAEAKAQAEEEERNRAGS